MSGLSASPRALAVLRGCLAMEERLDVLALETIFLAVEFLRCSLRETRSLVILVGSSLGAGMPDFLFPVAP